MRREFVGPSKIKLGILAFCLITGAFFAVSPTQARADEITLSGSTTGTFSNGLSTLQGMTFTGSSGFTQTTSGGVAALDLGSFSLSQTSGIYTGNFMLNLAFTSPLLDSITDVATIFGNVSEPYSGGVWIFNFSPETIFFNDGSGNTEDFTLAVNSISVTPGSTGTPLTAFVFYTGGNSGTVPEPSTMALAGLGIAGVFLLKKRLSLA